MKKLFKIKPFMYPISKTMVIYEYLPYIWIFQQKYIVMFPDHKNLWNKFFQTKFHQPKSNLMKETNIIIQCTFCYQIIVRNPPTYWLQMKCNFCFLFIWCQISDKTEFHIPSLLSQLIQYTERRIFFWQDKL